ncbi:hypothetical protein [Natrinema sp. 74]|uniref:hypothetical protein n=1 Tax=Natrinema sp. 74 TaxID=3384159 RepID=UPI0038D3B9A4
MTEDDTESEDNYLSTGDFLDEYYSQFAIMGIFGTVSVFLTSNFPDGTSRLVARSAIFASLTIFGFTAFWLCWRALTELLSNLHEGTRPITTEFGYTVIVLCTGTLCLAIGSAITTYTDVVQLAISIGVLAAGLVLYIRRFPNERYRGTKMDPAGVAMAAGFIVFFATTSLERGIYRALDTHFSSSFETDVVFVLFAALVHLTVCEAVSTVFKSELPANIDLHRIRTVGAQPRQLWARAVSYWQRQWPFHVSVTVCCVDLAILILGIDAVADRAVESPVIYMIAGYDWQTFVFYLMFAVTAIVAGLLWCYPETEDAKAIRRAWGKPLAVTVTVGIVSIVGLAWIGVIGGPSV